MKSTTSIILPTTQSEAPEGVIDFGVGHPAAGLLPRSILQQAAAQRLAQPDAALLQYGLEQGDGYFRLALSEFLTRHYGQPVGYEDLFVTCGASLALDLICTLYTQAGDTVLVEEPTYFLALRIFADHHLRVISIPCDEQGLRLDTLEEVLANTRPALLYTIPTHQNPSGATLPMERRQRLAELAETHDFMVVADEVYHLLSYGDAPPPPLAAWAGGGRVFSLGSFSKILAPGLRLGWVQAAPAHLERLVQSGLLDSGGGLNPFTSALVRVVLQEGWQDEYLALLKHTYSARIAVLDEALRREVGDAAHYVAPEGGYFFWLRLAKDRDAAELFARSAAYQVSFRPGVRFSSRDGLRNYLRLSFAFYEEDDLAEGARRLGRLITES